MISRAEKAACKQKKSEGDSKSDDFKVSAMLSVITLAEVKGTEESGGKNSWRLGHVERD